jgi:4-amino-4-deoxy-L-arabinose transferase-like glycosyltransferase
MNSVQMHLALTHVPVILSLVGLVMLMVALLKKNLTLTKTSYFIILIAGVAALPVFFSGEGAEEAVEHAPGVSEAIIEKHEEVAKLAMISIAAAGVFSLAALFFFGQRLVSRILKGMVLLVAVTSGGLMAQTAHLGGQIRHTEMRSGMTGQDRNEATGEIETGENNNQREEQNNN